MRRFWARDRELDTVPFGGIIETSLDQLTGAEGKFLSIVCVWLPKASLIFWGSYNLIRSLAMRMSFDAAAEIYDKTRGPPRQVMRQLIKTLANELHGYKTVLDIGIGTGRFAKPLQDSGLDVVGVDIAKKMISKAAKRGVRNLLRGDACFLPFRDDSFDVSVCIHLLHLISEWKTALHEVCRVTQKTMVSMSYVCKNPIREAYNRLLKGYGYESRRLGKGEWELKDFVRPAKSVFVASYDGSADERLVYLGQRAYSRQWQIPEDVNTKVVDKLKQQFAGRVFPQELRILIWNINDLKVYCAPAYTGDQHPALHKSSFEMCAYNHRIQIIGNPAEALQHSRGSIA